VRTFEPVEQTPYIKGNFRDPIIVPGCAKCGTSIVAVLLRVMGVFMGERYNHEIRPKGEPYYPYGTYEDWDFLIINHSERFASEAERKGAFRYLLWARSGLGLRWGFKCARFIDNLENFIDILKKPRFIYCTRPAKDCGLRTPRWNELRRKGEKFIAGRDDVLVVEFDEMVYGDTEKEIIRILEFVSIDYPVEKLLPYVHRRQR
jgi:hypothetical protein